MNKHHFYRYWLYFLAMLIASCTNSSVKKKPLKEAEINKAILSKPPANYKDTLKIDIASAVFYSPDTLQLQKIKEITEESIFEAQIHEYFFQMRNARMILKNNWPGIKIIEAKNVRYLLFRKTNKDSVCVDLDKKDLSGLFLFNRIKDPHPADMMNIDSELPFYFAK